MEVFDDILRKEKLERNDLELIIRKARVFEDHIEIQLKADIDSILRVGTLEECGAAAAAMAREDTVNFPEGIVDSLKFRFVQSAEKRPDKVCDVNIISDPSQITLASWERFCFGMLDLAKRAGWRDT